MTSFEDEGAREEEPVPVVSSGDLFQGDREIWLEYAGERFLLGITQAGKMMMTK